MQTIVGLVKVYSPDECVSLFNDAFAKVDLLEGSLVLTIRRGDDVIAIYPPGWGPVTVEPES